MWAVNMRFLFVFSALLLLASSASADGLYQRTKDKKTLVWNNYPEPGETVTWSGGRDKDGYASGEGTVTWYSAGLSGIRLPFFKSAVPTRYSGKMVRGKLDGPVVTLRANRQFHGTFVSGNKVSDWVPGPAPSPSRTSIASGTATADQPRKESIRQEAVVQSPAEGPMPTPVPAPPLKSDSESVRERSGATRPTNQDVAKPSPTEKGNEQTASGPAATKTPGDSTRSVTGVPSSLRTRDASEPSPQAPVASPSGSPVLNLSAVIELADAKVRADGYTLDDYWLPRVSYIPENDTWSLLYEPKSTGAMGDAGKPLNVSVEDKTKKISVPAKK
jgi:hypothetical protein